MSTEDVCEVDFNFKALRLRIEAKLEEDSFAKGCWKWKGRVAARGRYGKLRLTIAGSTQGFIHGLWRVH